MSWEKSRAQARIGQLIQSVPPTDISVENFSDQYFPRRLVERQVVKSQGEAFGPPILKLPYRKAILVDGVHVYANLVSFDDFLVEKKDKNGKQAEHHK